MTQPEINSESPNRDTKFSNDPDDQFVDIPLTPKEAVDVYHAMNDLVERVESMKFDTDLPVHEMRNIALGGMHFPDEFSLLIASPEHARTVLHALAKYEPPEADFTERLQDDILENLEESPMDFDVAALRKLAAST